MAAGEEKSPRRIAILGSTGSIGTQALEVIERHPEALQVEVLAAYSNAKLLIEQARKHKPNIVVAVEEQAYKAVKDALADEDIKVFFGEDALCGVCEMDCVDMVLSSIVGVAGLRPAYATVACGTPLAIANKETLVVAGDIIMGTAAKNNAPVLPVDSEHSAIFQCLAGEFQNPVEKIIITASGGAFRGFTKEQLQNVTLGDALRHPNWSMGPKVTIDSATLMNKGLEIIEAKWLFNTPLDDIEVVVHPQSVIHSMVQFRDGAVKAQLGIPDMRLPILYALSYPLRLPLPYPRLDFRKLSQLTFEQPDTETFPCLDIAYKAAREGGGKPCIMNAANEAAVSMFMNGKISFTDIPRIIEDALATVSDTKPSDIDGYLSLDTEVKAMIFDKYGRPCS